MYFLLGLQKNLDTIAILTKNFLKQDSKCVSFSDLKEAYFPFINVIQPKVPQLYSKKQIHFVEDGDLLGQLINLFIDDNSESQGSKISGYDFKKIAGNRLKRKFQLIKKSLDTYSENNVEYCFLTQLLFSYIFLIQSEGVTCATSPKAMGLLLMDHKEWTVEDICEMFIHETAHQLVSLDEYRYEHYIDLQELNTPENYAVSAVRRTKRPLNKVIHSLIVAFEIFSYRNSVAKPNVAVKVHPETSVIKTQIMEAIDSIAKEQRLKNLLSPRVSLILELIEQRMH